MKKNKIKYVIFSILLLSSFLGCSPYETARLTGLGIKPFKTKGDIYSQTFEKDLTTCYKEAEKIIENFEALLYRGSLKEGFIVSLGYNQIFPSASYATEVALFFNKIDENKTKIQISSLNHNLSEFISEKIFQELE
ncbi:MAG: hypothetical protein R6U54_05985 [Candidatus Omnitrophota bacterium]